MQDKLTNQCEESILSVFWYRSQYVQKMNRGESEKKIKINENLLDIGRVICDLHVGAL